MTMNKARIDKAVILGVLLVGVLVSYGLQSFIWQSSSKEARYEFESQTSNLTLFIIDDFKNLIDEFVVFSGAARELAATVKPVKLVYTLEKLLLEHHKPLFFTIYSRSSAEASYRADSAWQHRYYFGDKIEPELRQAVEQMEDSGKHQLKSFFFSLPSVGHTVCMVDDLGIGTATVEHSFITACFELATFLDPVLQRSSYDWLDIYLYSGGIVEGYQQIYQFSESGRSDIKDPLAEQSGRSIFLPRVVEAGGQQLSVLFTARPQPGQGIWVDYLPLIFGVFLTLLIALYLVSVSRRNAEVSRKVELKTRELTKAKVKLEIEVENKGYLYQKIKASVDNLESVTNSVNGVIWEANPETMEYTYISSQVTNILGYEPEEYLSGRFKLGGQKVPEGQLSIREMLLEKMPGEENFTLEYQGYRRDGKLIWVRNIITKVFESDKLVRIRGVFLDITEEKSHETERLEMESQLKHAQKMEAIGQLAAGIAHEINTPSQFVGDNLNFIQDAMNDSFAYIGTLEKLLKQAGNDSAMTAMQNAHQEQDIEFLSEEVPQALEQSIDGISRISKIVSAMKEFSHPGLENKQKVDLNHAIESTVVVARNEWKYLADVHLEMADDLPMVNCFPGEINQTILNMIVNSAHAIEAKTAGEDKGNITITTSADDGQVVIEIADDGIGMEEHVRNRVFEHFFTTKEVGKGTGQGLSIAYSVIVEKHSGSLVVDSHPGDGSRFTITLPLD